MNTNMIKLLLRKEIWLYHSEKRHGYIVDEIDQEYVVVDSRGTQTINISRLLNDLTGWLLMERHQMKAKINDLESRLLTLESKFK